MASSSSKDILTLYLKTQEELNKWQKKQENFIISNPGLLKNFDHPVAIKNQASIENAFSEEKQKPTVKAYEEAVIREDKYHQTCKWVDRLIASYDDGTFINKILPRYHWHDWNDHMHIVEGKLDPEKIKKLQLLTKIIDLFKKLNDKNATLIAKIDDTMLPILVECLKLPILDSKRPFKQIEFTSCSLEDKRAVEMLVPLCQSLSILSLSKCTLSDSFLTAWHEAKRLSGVDSTLEALCFSNVVATPILLNKALQLVAPEVNRYIYVNEDRYVLRTNYSENMLNIADETKSPVIHDLLKLFPSSKKIRFYNNSYSKDLVIEDKDIISFAIERSYIYKSSVLAEGALIHTLNHLSRLQHLIFHNLTFQDSETKEAFLKAVLRSATQPTVKLLYLTDCNLDDLSLIIQYLKNNTQLERLNLMGNKLSVDQLNALADCIIKNNLTIKLIDLDGGMFPELEIALQRNCSAKNLAIHAEQVQKRLSQLDSQLEAKSEVKEINTSEQLTQLQTDFDSAYTSAKKCMEMYYPNKEDSLASFQRLQSFIPKIAAKLLAFSIKQSDPELVLKCHKEIHQLVEKMDAPAKLRRLETYFTEEIQHLEKFIEHPSVREYIVSYLKNFHTEPTLAKSVNSILIRSLKLTKEDTDEKVVMARIEGVLNFKNLLRVSYETEVVKLKQDIIDKLNSGPSAIHNYTALLIAQENRMDTSPSLQIYLKKLQEMISSTKTETELRDLFDKYTHVSAGIPRQFPQHLIGTFWLNFIKHYLSLQLPFSDFGNRLIGWAKWLLINSSDYAQEGASYLCQLYKLNVVNIVNKFIKPNEEAADRKLLIKNIGLCSNLFEIDDLLTIYIRSGNIFAKRDLKKILQGIKTNGLAPIMQICLAQKTSVLKQQEKSVVAPPPINPNSIGITIPPPSFNPSYVATAASSSTLSTSTEIKASRNEMLFRQVKNVEAIKMKIPQHHIDDKINLGSIIFDPVVAADGYTYERATLLQWMANKPKGWLSPHTNELIESTAFIPNKGQELELYNLLDGIVQTEKREVTKCTASTLTATSSSSSHLLMQSKLPPVASAPPHTEISAPLPEIKNSAPESSTVPTKESTVPKTTTVSVQDEKEKKKEAVPKSVAILL